jgi:predicted phosphodiesterase
MPDLSEIVAADDPLLDAIRSALKRKRSYTVEHLADTVDASPRRVRDGIEQLRDAGFRIPEERDGQVELQRVPPTKAGAVHKLPMQLLDGDRIRFGVVSDTHLCSKECALEELHLAYDYFEREEISTVLHPGDLVAGVGIFKGQHNEITHHTFEDQRDFAVEHYPNRTGITTHIIGGNHDLEGDFGKIGADPVKGVANKRADLEYLGPYSAWLELVNGAYVHLLHGKGGMSYAYSYKMQKLCEAYPAGRKPAALILGHFHVQAGLQARGIQGMFPGCFEWSSKQFGDRLGLTPAVGFHVVEAQLGDDGSVVEWLPRWKPIWEGRVVAVAAA